ncbi:MAG: hypothetical protein F6J87_31645 [Spirulina sp. SIO3F2]|nr:hypothetical protein [Spirulina sp. SIO3F2]
MAKDEVVENKVEGNGVETAIDATPATDATVAQPSDTASLDTTTDEEEEAKISVPLPDDVLAEEPDESAEIVVEQAATSEESIDDAAPNLLPEDVATPFHTAVNHANQAVKLIPQATNPTDWNRIAQEWEQAVKLMAMVPADHPQAELAQAKVEEYQGYLEYAQTQSQNPDHAFLLAVRRAEAAAQTSQAAQATRNWQAVLEGWDEAIAAMKAVPVESEHYGLAQEKVREYQGYREAIQAIAAGQPLASAAR